MTNVQLYLYVKAFSDFGSMMDMIVFSSIILGETHSAGWVSASLCARTLGGVLSSLSSGTLADRMERRRLMMWSDLARCACIVVLLCFANPTLIVVGSLLLGFLSSYFGVSFSASIPEMFGEGRVLKTNALISRLAAVSMVAGFLLAGVISKFLGYGVVLGIDAASYVLSAAVLLRMRWQTKPSPKSRELLTKKKPTFIQELSEVWRYLCQNPVLLLIFSLYFVETFGAASHNLGIPILAQIMDPHNQVFMYGLIWGVWGIGNVLSSLVLPKLRLVQRHIVTAYFISALCMSAGFITFLSNTSAWVVLPFAFATGLFDAAAGTLYSTLMQKSGNHIRGRVFGVSSLINRLGFGVGFIVAPFVMQSLSLAHMVQVFHGTVITCTVASILIYLRYLSNAGRERGTWPSELSV